jgi:CRP-like cAMP-binding protein
MARAPTISSLSPPENPPENPPPRYVKWIARWTARLRGSIWPTTSRLSAAAVADCPGTGCPAPSAQLSPSNSIIAGLPREELNHLKPRLQRVSWHSGQILAGVATPLDCFYFPESGMVCRFAVMDDGRTVALAAVGREGFLGVPAFLGAESAQLRAVVLIAGDALQLSQDDLWRILPVSPQFAASLHCYTGCYLAQIAAIGACHALHSVHHRVASWLLMARDRSNSHSLPLTHESLSELLGCRRATVTDALSWLENAGVIHCGRGHISILDHSRLAEQTCECYRSLKRRAASA